MFQFLPDIDVNPNPEKRKILPEGDDELWEPVKKKKQYLKVMPELIEHLD